MNKIYKLVWSKVRNTWVVASEIAKGHGKNASATRERKLLKTAVITAIMGGLMTAGMSPVAALTPDQQAVYEAVMAQLKASAKVELGGTTTDTTGIAIGGNALSEGEYSTAIGHEAISKAAHSMVIGIGSRSEAPNSTVLGNNNTLKRYNADKNGSSSRNNIVVGQSLEVEGAYNAVFGTDYQNNTENRKTMAAGKYNTVIGVGNLAGYTAEKDPQDRFKWIYSKVENGMDSGNVVVGMNNTATRGSLVIGAESEASSHGTSVGHDNKIIGDSDYGVALGSHLIVDGEQAVAIGSKSKATADYAVAIGQEALAEKESSIAFGNSAKAQNNYSVAIGAFADAKSRSGVAIGSSSLADREKGIKGYLAGKDDESEIWKSTRGAVSVGNNEKKYTRQIIGVAAGSEDTDAVNVAQLKALNTKVEGNKIHYLSIGPDNEKNLAQDGNYNNDGADSHWGIAIGVNASSKGGGSIAIGKGSQAHGTEEHRAQGVSIGSASRAIGAFATAVGHDTKAFGEYSVAYGLGDAYGRGSIAIGSGAVAALKEGITKEEYNKLSDEEKAWYGKTDYDDQKIFYQFRHKGKDGKVEDIKNYGMAIGSGATSFDNAGLAVGLNAKTNKNFGVALGAYAENKVEQGVALGTSSVADRAKDVKGYLPTTGKAIENFEEAMKATGKEAAFKELKGKYLAAQEKLAKAQEAYNADQSPTNMMNLDKAQKELKGLTEEYAVMTAPWTSRRGAVSVGNDKTGFTRQITGVAAGSEDTDAVNVAQLKALNTKVDKGAIHYFSVKSDDSANPAGTNWNNDGATGQDAVAIGKNAGASGKSAFATGWKSKAAGYSDIAIGREAEATGGWGVAIGQSAKAQASTAVAMAFAAEATGANSLAIGVQSEAKMDDSTAYGRGAKALGQVALAVGTLTKAEGNHSSVFGYKATTDSTAWNGTAIGRGAYIGKQAPDGTTPDIGVSDNYYTPVDDDTATEAGKETKNSTAVGFGAKSFGYQNTAVGAGAEAFDTNTVAVGVMSKAIGHYANALGKQARAEGKDSIAIGHFARAIGESSTVLGDYAITSTLDGKKGVSKSVAVGSHARAASDNSIALGNNSLANIADNVKTEAYLSKETFKKENGVVSVGNKEYTVGNEKIEQNYRRITNVAGGADDHDAVNVAQLKALNDKVDKSGVHYFSVKSDDSANPAGTNWNNDGAKKDGSIAIGPSALNNGTQSVAVGLKSKVEDGWYSVALGTESKTNGHFTTAIGYQASATKLQSLALGTNAEAAAESGISIGVKAKSLAKRGIAVGTNSTVGATGGRGIAIGDGSYVGAKTNDHPGTGMPNPGDAWKPGEPYVTADDDTVAGPGKLSEENSMAIGMKASAFGFQTIALGAGAEAHDTNTTAVGVAAFAKGNYSTALGKQARTFDKESTSVGHWADSRAEFATSVGANTIVYKKGGVALGSGARAYDENSIAIGSNSIAKEAVDGKAYLSEEEVKAVAGIVSVGNPAYKAGDKDVAANYRRIVNVAGGINDNDAVNVAQLKVVNEKADKNATDITNLTKTVNANGKATKVTVDGEENKTNGNLKITKKTVDGQTTYDLSLNDELTIGKDGKDGKIGINGKDGKSAEITVGKGEPGVDGTNGKDGITRIIYKDEKGNHHEVATLDDGLKFKGDNADVVIRKLNTQLNITGGAKAEDLSDDNIGVVGTAGDNGGMAVKLSKKLKGLTSAEFKDGDNITNITAENVTITRKEGKVDLWELNKTVNNITAGTTDVSSWKLQANGANERVIKKDSVVNFKNGTNTEVTVNGNDITVDLNAATQKQINDNTTNINNIDKRVTTIENNIDQKIEGAKITVEGDTTTGVKATEVKTGDKVTGYKVSLDNKVTVGNVAIDGKDGKGEITGLTNTTVDAADFATKGRAATEEQLKAAMGKVQAQGRTTVKGSTNITVKPDTKGASEYTVELAKDITVDSVTAKTVKADEYKVGDKTYINDKGIDANGNKITNVADGVVSKDSKDAVNGSQLFATNQMVVNNMNQINNLREESREGDALGAAMAALKPLDFDPYQRNQVMAGVGYYRGKEAVALGLAHYKNEDLMIHGGLAYAGNSELMANVGVSYRFGSKDDRDIKHDRNLRMPQYAEGPISSVYILQDEVDRLTKENKEANDRIAALEAKLEKVLEKVK